jgi:hypothetical protein
MLGKHSAMNALRTRQKLFQALGHEDTWRPVAELLAMELSTPNLATSELHSDTEGPTPSLSSPQNQDHVPATSPPMKPGDS